MKEYEKNNETSGSISFKVGRKTLFYDATRRYNQYGLYMNHSRNPNARIYSPITIRGKSRLGIYSIQDVQEDEELEWDYGITTSEMPWLQSKGKSLHL